MLPNRTTAVAAVASFVVLISLVLVSIVAAPGLVGGDDAFVVTSGSMSPEIQSGDVIVTQDVPAESIETGDVVTVRAEDGAASGYVTHRVVDIEVDDGDRYFQLQGDANPDPDPGYAVAEDIVGTTHLHIPYLGYMLLFASSDIGLFALVIVPGVLLVASGSWQLLREFGYLPLDDAVGAEGDE
ncbi:signal peptidase I [Halobacteria archaeon AArc-dxtr1]|nr:signal peptidase I [Halobacteria archaeon AArc-dxtr1]